MASSSRLSNYPPLLYAKGKAPSQKKSMSYYSYLSNFQMVEVGVGNDAWDALKKSSVGVIPRFYELDYTWCAKIVHHLLTHQLVVKKKYEIWSLVFRQPIRLSLIEFGQLTGLNCDPFEDGDNCDIDHTEFWGELKVPTSVGPTLNELQLVLGRCKTWSFEKRRMVGWLCILHIAIYGISPTSRIPLECAKRVLDFDAFERYPWGRVACKSLIRSIKCANYHAKKSYTMEGFVHVLLIWAYESINGLGELYGDGKVGSEIPLLSWGGGRKRFDFDDFFTQEKKAHEDKVRVKNFLPRSNGKIMPEWDDEVEDDDLDNLVHDILHSCVIENTWDVIEAPMSKRRKHKEDVLVNDSEISKKQKKTPDKQFVGKDGDSDPLNDDGNEISGEPKQKYGEIGINGLLTMMKKNIFLDKKKAVKQEAIPNLVDDPEETWSNPVERQNNKEFGNVLDALLAKITKLDDGSPLNRRQTKLAPTQLFPFIGNSTVKRIITGVTPSRAAYDPLDGVEDDKIQNLLYFLLSDEAEPDATSDSSVEFYKVIITPRTEWPNATYGWLNESHIWSAMHMFHKRSLRDPSPYHSHRIVFLNQWFISKLVLDFKDFNIKTWTATEPYKGIFNGTYPTDSVTNKRWFLDVDHLYACHFVNGNHWVALDIDLKKEIIHVYDSILSCVYDDKDIRTECRPFAKMIPAILNAMVPTSVRKKKEKQFTVRRLKNVPQNDNPGDCGVYTIKYIECLAIGCTFEGLSDSNIPELRRKLAAEIYDEVGQPGLAQLFPKTPK